MNSEPQGSGLRVVIAAPHLSIAMLEVYKGVGSTGRPLLNVLYAKNWTSTKVPVGIDLSRASFTLCQFEKRVVFAKKLSLGFGTGRSCGFITPLQIIARASVARGSCDWVKAAIFSRSCFLMMLSVSPPDSSFILLTSRETCAANISGKLCQESEHLQ